MTSTSWFILIGSAVIILPVVATVICLRIAGREDALLKQAQSERPSLLSKCMICDGYIEAPGIAMIIAGTLVTRSVLGTERRFPLLQVRVKSESRSFGRYSWWGKRIFHLDVPGVARFAIGVEQAQPWRDNLRQNQTRA